MTRPDFVRDSVGDDTGVSPPEAADRKHSDEDRNGEPMPNLESSLASGDAMPLVSGDALSVIPIGAASRFRFKKLDADARHDEVMETCLGTDWMSANEAAPYLKVTLGAKMADFAPD